MASNILKNVIKVTQDQYTRLLAGETVGGLVYDSTAIYLVEKSGGSDANFVVKSYDESTGIITAEFDI